MRLMLFIIATLWVAAAPQTAAQAADAPVVNIYSYRQPELIVPILDRFTAKTGIKTQIIFAKKGLIERVRIEGTRSPADIILTTDIGLLQATEAIAQPVPSPLLMRRIPLNARSSNHLWFGLSLRARAVFVARARVATQQLAYTDLATAQWRGRICMRSGQHPYNIALFAAMLAHLGEADFTHWLQGLKDNLARPPSGNDRAQVRAVYAGTCDIAIGNTYYMGKMLTNDKQPQQKEWGKAVRIIFPDMPRGGTHVNISGMAMAKHAPHPDAARALMEFLVSDEAQQLYAERNFEYPIVASVPPSALVASWGKLRRDPLALEDIAAHRIQAGRIVDALGFND